MSSALNLLSQSGKRAGSGSLPKMATSGYLTEATAKELNECLCGIVVNASTCLRMLSAVIPNVEGARETARRTICCTNRAAEAVSNLRALIETVAPGREGSSRVARGGTS